MKRTICWALSMVAFLGFSAFKVHAVDTSAITTETIVENIEKRYDGEGFSARFDQISNIAAIEVSDTASGRIYVKRPGMMRWEYESPQRQSIITNGKILWVYRPDEKQVMVGDAPDYFGDGKGVSFLSDLSMLRNNFEILRVDEDRSDFYRLKLTPRKTIPDVSDIYLLVSKTDFSIVRIATYNSYGDETLIDLHQIHLDPKMDDRMFTFALPPGTEVLQMAPAE